MKIVAQQVIEVLPLIKEDIDTSMVEIHTPLTAYGFDSLDLMNLYFQIEESLNVTISLDEGADTSQLLSIDQIVRFCNTD